MSNTLYLASQSQARHLLLKQAAIPFVVVPINVVEEEAEVSGTVDEQVCALADYKHSGIDVAQVVATHNPPTDRPLFFLTADTLIAGVDTGTLYGKARDKEHATQMIREIARQEVDVVTGMCLSVWQHDADNDTWQQTSRTTWPAGARARFSVPDHMIDHYLATCPAAMLACGATVIEEIGIRYFESINGSYTGTLGIDLYTLCQHLETQGFWK